jgi:hypothetical protein
MAEPLLSETIPADTGLLSALECVEHTGAAGDLPAYVGIELYNALAEARAELARLHEEAADALVQQTTLKGMTVEEGAAVLQLGPPRELVIAWVDAARKMLGDAPNYSETRIDFPAASMEVKAAGEVERYVFTVQRAGRLTPHEARQRAESERDQATAELVRVRAAVTDLADEAPALIREKARHPDGYTFAGLAEPIVARLRETLGEPGHG